MKKFIYCLCLIAFVGSTSTNCLIDYKNYPKADPLSSENKIYDKKLVYNLPYFPQFNLGGRESLETYFQVKTPFKKTEAGVQVPNDGYLVDVKVDYRSPSKPALAFLILSTMTITLLPAWSEEDGYDVRYILWKNGKEVETFKYSIERRYGQWMPLILAFWYNAKTASEKSVFERLTKQFFADAEKHFN
ncbi:LIC12231 family lipoprotein [Leptospira sp. GIMC2001]|uniref:LIC12231 family lipoprotein n=1 Tax=Leptospira sp. GIMC2001 TaxID=1513297 RepID=UPI00234AB91F|nr:hypothetical protein [Leptospira sp. GIMC2001]WCL49876.1 hypothetical protein O4O04_03395 [Leptospira sp. GIMC2001]